MKVAVIGASNKPHRYSYKAVMLLKEKGHQTFPVHPRIKEIEGMRVFSSVNEINDSLDTVTMYVGVAASDLIGDDIIAKNPKRIIFNPGAENPALEKKAKDKGIIAINACTLVMLKTGRF